MRMALVYTSIGDAGELGIMQFLDGLGTTVSHARTQTAHHLIYHFLNGSLVRNTTSNTLGYQFLHILGVGLEITVL